MASSAPIGLVERKNSKSSLESELRSAFFAACVFLAEEFLEAELLEFSEAEALGFLSAKFEELLEFSALKLFSLFADFVLESPEAWESPLLAELAFLEFFELFFSAELELCLLSSLELLDFVLSALFMFRRASSFS